MNACIVTVPNKLHSSQDFAQNESLFTYKTAVLRPSNSDAREFSLLIKRPSMEAKFLKRQDDTKNLMGEVESATLKEALSFSYRTVMTSSDRDIEVCLLFTCECGNPYQLSQVDIVILNQITHMETTMQKYSTTSGPTKRWPRMKINNRCNPALSNPNTTCRKGDSSYGHETDDHYL